MKLPGRWRAAALAAALVTAAGAAPVPAGATPLRATQDADTATRAAVTAGWRWPLESFRITRFFLAPAHRYGPGHRGIDLQPVDEEAVRSPADGVVAFAGQVAGRGIVTIDHGAGLVTTLEPVANLPVPGTRVAAGQEVGRISSGGHSAGGTVHFGVREHGEYINPMLLLGSIPRAILLPCC